MKQSHHISHVVNGGLCIGCGLCVVDSRTDGLRFSQHNDCNVPQNLDVRSDSLANSVCPGVGYAIESRGRELYGIDAEYDLDLGFSKSCQAVRTEDEEILENASSGGAITSILLYLLDKQIVDKVSVTQFECDKNGVHTKSFLTSDKDEILKAQGSKYCPVDLSGLLKELGEYDGKVAIMATPCAIAGIRNIQKYAPNKIKSHIVFCIANFCGGHKSFKNIKRLAEIHQVDYNNLTDFRFRGEGQPGSLRFVEKGGKEAKTRYPLYVGLNGYSKMLRCHLCVDATGEMADIACGDAWIPRFEKDEHPWSMVICRDAKSSDIIKKMSEDGWLVLEDITQEEVKLSQRLNLASKKKRQATRRKLYGMLGYRLPDFQNEGYYLELTPMKTECIVYFKHQLKLLAEKIGWYMALYGHKKLKKRG